MKTMLHITKDYLYIKQHRNIVFFAWFWLYIDKNFGGQDTPGQKFANIKTVKLFKTL